jgi:hypothetical protein
VQNRQTLLRAALLFSLFTRNIDELLLSLAPSPSNVAGILKERGEPRRRISVGYIIRTPTSFSRFSLSLSLSCSSPLARCSRSPFFGEFLPRWERLFQEASAYTCSMTKGTQKTCSRVGEISLEARRTDPFDVYARRSNGLKTTRFLVPQNLVRDMHCRNFIQRNIPKTLVNFFEQTAKNSFVIRYHKVTSSNYIINTWLSHLNGYY